jgi:2'-5' RNA ligase
MRLFAAIDLPDELVIKLERLLNVLRAEAPVKWSPLDNLHITTKFIGEWPADRLEEIKAALSTLAPRESFKLELRDLGWFPNDRSPRVLWLGVHGSSALYDLARRMDDSLAGLGIAPEKREFTPHLTLGQIKTPVPLDRLRKKVQELQPAMVGSFEVDRFHLFRSDAGSHASVYRRLATFAFGSRNDG